MKRIHFFELEDLPWFPNVLRDAGTGFLNASQKLAGLDKLFVPKIVELLHKTQIERIVDLGSGAGGPAPEIIQKIRTTHGFRKIRLLLTDFYPNRDAQARYRLSDFSEFVDYHSESVDAAHVPGSLSGLRTMFLSFHHMPEHIARGILADAQSSRQPIAIFEAFGRNAPSFLGMLPIGLIPFLVMPIVKPFRIVNLILTYVFPIIPLFIVFDGWVSFFRTYSPKELGDLISALPRNHNYRWEVGVVGRQRAPYLIGHPV